MRQQQAKLHGARLLLGLAEHSNRALHISALLAAQAAGVRERRWAQTRACDFGCRAAVALLPCAALACAHTSMSRRVMAHELGAPCARRNAAPQVRPQVTVAVAEEDEQRFVAAPWCRHAAASRLGAS